MAIHELGSNSMKYGAIGTDGASLSISWDELLNDGCLLIWKEQGVTAEESRQKSCYGTMLLNTIIPSQLDGTAAREIKRTSFTYSLEIGKPG